MARTELVGLQRALRAIRRIPGAAREARAETLRQWADDVQGTAQTRAPRRTGLLESHIDQNVDASRGQAEVGVWDPEAMKYAPHVEHGTSDTPDQPFLEPAFNLHRREVERIYRAALRRRLGGG